MIPITTAVRKRYGLPHLPLTGDEQQKLPDSLRTLRSQLSRRGPSAYVEAEFWGGEGMQACVLFNVDTAQSVPLVEIHAINHALQVLGVRRDGYHDEFAAIELGRHREVDDWTSDRFD
jgi:hypothetical protein